MDLAVECHNRGLWITFTTFLAKWVTCPQLHCFYKMQNRESPRIYLLRYHVTNFSLLVFSLSLPKSSLSAWLSLSLARAPSVFVSLFLLLNHSFCWTHFMFPPSLFLCFLFLSKSHSLIFLFPFVTYFPLLSFCSSFTLPIVYWYSAQVALRASFARAWISMRMRVHVWQNERDITKTDKQGQRNFDAAGRQHQGRLGVHPALITTTKLSRGWWTFVSDKKAADMGTDDHPRLIISRHGLKILYLWSVGNAADMLSLVFRISGGLGTYPPQHFILTFNEYFWPMW